MDTLEVIKSLSPMKNPFRSVLIFGPPGSGKGTIGKFLSIAGNHLHLSSGDIFRGLSPDSPAGKLHHIYASKGHLVPDEVTIQIWHHYVEGLIATNRYFPHQQLMLLDGIPRTLAQAKMCDKYLDVSKIIVLESAHPDVLIKRLQRRSLIEGRHDDKEEKTLKMRMEVYERETLCLLEHYPQNLIARFNAEQRPLEVLRDVLVELSSFLS